MLGCFYPFSLVSIYFYSSQSVKYNSRWIWERRDGEEWYGIGPTRATTETQDGTGGRSDRRERLLSFLNSFYSPLLLILLLFGCPFLQSTIIGGAGRGMTTTRAGRRIVRAFLGRSGGQGFMFRYFLFPILLFSFLAVLIF